MLSSKSKPSTPDNMKFLAGNGGAINKSLLTPCRRVGLSKKSKTPLQDTRSDTAMSNVEAVISPASNASIDNKESLLTPKTKELDETVNKKSTVKGTLNKKNTKVVKNIQKEVNFSDNITKQITQEYNACNDDVNKNINKKSRQKKEKALNKDTFVEEKSESTNSNKSCSLSAVDSDDDLPKKTNKPTKRKILDDDDNKPASPKTEESPVSKTTNKKLCKDSTQQSYIIKQNLCGKQLKIVLEKCNAPSNTNETSEGFRKDDKNTFADTSVIAQKHENLRKKTVKRCLSLKSNSNCSQDDMDLDDFCVRTNNSATNSPVNDTNNLINPYSYSNTSDSDTIVGFNNVTSNQSSDEEDFQPSPEFINNLSLDIKTIKKRIQEKEQELNKLKQAEIYKKLHKTEELKQLTSVWKIGCKQALQDLQMLASSVDSTMDMPKLLQKLNVPNEIFTCTPNGTLI